MARIRGWRPLEIKYQGRVITGDWCLMALGVTVATRRSCRSKELDEFPAEHVAETLLRELAVDGLA